MKIEGLVFDVTGVGSPYRAERAILGMILGVFGSIQATFPVWESRCYVGTRSWALVTLLRVI